MAPLSFWATLSLASTALAVPADLRKTTASCSSSSHSSSSSRSTSHSTSHSSTSSISTTTSVPVTTPSSAANTNPTTTLVATSTSKKFGLNDAAKRAGKLWFGTAFDYPGTGEASDPYYMAEFRNTHDFGEATPANIMKFVNTEPQQGVFNFTGGDDFLKVAEAAGKKIRCHNLIWQSQLPDWVTSPATPWTNATLTAVLENHVKTLVAHFGDRCYSWDVVNEALADSPAGAWQPNVWYNTIGSSYVALAFAAAQETIRKNQLHVKLYYNDYNIENPGAKSTAAQNNIVKDLKARKIQIDGVGLESHFIAGSTPSQADQEANMRAFAALDVDVVVTELDVRTPVPPTLADEQAQVQDYKNTVAACKNVKQCLGVVVWDFDDTYSWIPGTFPGQGYGDIFFQPKGAGTPLVKKAVYDGIMQGWGF